MKTEFACIAEAVAYFYNRGYETLDSSTEVGVRRVMYKPGDDQLLCPMIEILKTGFLKVECREIM